MGMIDIKRQAPNVARMKMLGAEVRPALSGSKNQKMRQDNEFIRDWINNPVDTYIIGSVVGPHPYPDTGSFSKCHLSRNKKHNYWKRRNRKPDYVIACVGGGSNAAGTYYHFWMMKT
jgi:tryptophan synthase beta chain